MKDTFILQAASFSCHLNTESASLIHITSQAFNSETPSFFISHLYLEKNNIWASFLGVAFNRIEVDYEVADIYGKGKKDQGGE